jgi:hypothetical protein
MQSSLLKTLTVGFSALLVFACSEKKDEKAPPCTFTIKEYSPPKLATYANTFNIPYDQEILMNFMVVDFKESECFAQQYAPVHIYKIPFDGADSTFVKDLTLAPETNLKTWLNFEDAYGSSLKGLTTFRFEDTADEKIIESTIMLRTDADQWHLWHEFSHFLIGTLRSSSHDHNLHIAEETTLEKLKADLIPWSSDEDTALTKIQSYFNTKSEYIMKRYIDEMVIEATLVYLTTQPNSPFKVSQKDLDDSLRLIDFFYFKLNFILLDTQNEIEAIKLQHSATKAQLDLLDMYEQKMKQQRVEMDRIVRDTKNDVLQYSLVPTNP